MDRVLSERGHLHEAVEQEQEDMQRQLDEMWKKIDKVDSHSRALQTTEDVLSLANTFDLFDKDESGGIDASELRRALQHLGVDSSSKQADAILKQYDDDSNSSIDVKEFARLARDVQMMHSFDTNGDGTLDAEELVPALRSLGMSVRAEHSTKILKQWDTDGNGFIDLVECVQL